MSGGPKTIAEGALGQTPLEHVLVSVDKRRLSGTLAIWPDVERPGQDRILFEEGKIRAARLLDPASALERGLLPLFLRGNAPYAFYDGNLLGEGEGVATGDVDVFALLAARLRGGEPERFVTHVLGALADQPLRVHGRVSLDRYRFTAKERAIVDLLRAEPVSLEDLSKRTAQPKRTRRLLYLLRITGAVAPMAEGETSGAHRSGAAPEASGAHRAPPSAAPQEPSPRISSPPSGSHTAPSGSHIAPSGSYAAPSGSHSSPSGAHAAPSGSHSVPSGAHRLAQIELPPDPPATLSDDHRKRWREIADYVVEIDGQNYFEMLGIKENAEENAIRDAYFRQVKRFHPDRLPPDLAPLLPFADRIFHYLTEAKDTLSDARARIRYKATVQQGGGTPAADRQLARVVNAAMDFQKVEVLVRRRAWPEALAILEEALAASPEEADYHAMKGWVLLQRDGTAKKKDADTILECANKALEQAPDHERALLTRATALKQLDRIDEALKDFDTILRNNPRHVEATREIRLARMRGQKPGGAPPKGSGFLSKLFGGGKKKK